MHPICRPLALLALAGVVPAQDDLRDVVQLKSGKEIRGRLKQPFAADELLIVQGGKRVRVPRVQVQETQLVSTAIRDFLQRRERMRDNPRAQWILVEWAQSKELVALARLQAMQMAWQSDDERAHEFLGHRRRNDEWQWPHDGRWYGRDHLLAQVVKSPITLEGERFRLRCDGDLGPNIAALFDLERLAVWWYDTFGAALGLEEVLEPVNVVAHRDATGFQKWGFRPMPYFVPAPHGDEARTFYAGPDPVRPRQLFFVGSHAFLYRTLIGDVDLRNDRDRVCPWLEVGLSMLAEQTFGGDPGHAAPGAPRMQDMQALQALARDYRLTHLLHLPMYGGFYLMDDTATAIHWSAAAMFVQFLLREDNSPPTRAAFLAYVRAALGERKGDSSSLFDEQLGRRVEDFEQPFRTWLEKVAGI